jgi:hypothetical protein
VFDVLRMFFTDRKPVSHKSSTFPAAFVTDPIRCCYFRPLKSYGTRTISKIIVRVSYDVRASPSRDPYNVLKKSCGYPTTPVRLPRGGLHTGTLRLEPRKLERAQHGPRQIYNTGMPQNLRCPRKIVRGQVDI